MAQVQSLAGEPHAVAAELKKRERERKRRKYREHKILWLIRFRNWLGLNFASILQEKNELLGLSHLARWIYNQESPQLGPEA